MTKEINKLNQRRVLDKYELKRQINLLGGGGNSNNGANGKQTTAAPAANGNGAAASPTPDVATNTPVQSTPASVQSNAGPQAPILPSTLLPFTTPSDTHAAVQPTTTSTSTVQVTTSSAAPITTSSATSSTSVKVVPSSTLSVSAVHTITQAIATVDEPSTTLDLTGGSSATATPQASGDVKAGTIIGAAAGAILGIAVLAFTVMFAVRYWRRRREDEEAFDAAQFRQSAVILPDDPAFSSGNGGNRVNNMHPSEMPPQAMAQVYSNNNNMPASYGPVPGLGADKHMSTNYTGYGTYGFDPTTATRQRAPMASGAGAGAPAPNLYVGTPSAPTSSDGHSVAPSGLTVNAYLSVNEVEQPLSSPRSLANPFAADEYVVPPTPPHRDENLPLPPSNASNQADYFSLNRESNASVPEHIGTVSRPLTVANMTSPMSHAESSESGLASSPELEPEHQPEVVDSVPATKLTRSGTVKTTIYDPEDVYGGI